MANRWKNVTIRFRGKRFIQPRIIQPIDGVGDSRLGIAEHCQSVVFCFIRLASATGTLPVPKRLAQSLATTGSSIAPPNYLTRIRQVADDPSWVIHDPVGLRDHVSRGNVCNLFAQEVEAVDKTMQDRFHFMARIRSGTNDYG